MIIQNQYNKLHTSVTRDPRKDYRGAINNAITRLDTTPTTRTFGYIRKNSDFLIKTLDQEISIRQFMRSQYDSAPYIKPGKKPHCEFLFEMKGLGGKHIQYPMAYIDNTGFWFSIFHECVHARDYKKDQKNKKILNEEDAQIANEKSAWTEGYHIAQQFQSIHKINLLEEFSCIEDICMYANIHLLLSTYPTYRTNIEAITLTADDFSISERTRKKPSCIPSQ